jgi:hypothetical protein
MPAVEEFRTNAVSEERIDGRTEVHKEGRVRRKEMSERREWQKECRSVNRERSV